LYAGGIFIGYGAATRIINSNFSDCLGDVTGGGLATSAAFSDKFAPFFAHTELEIDAKFTGNRGIGPDVWAGPLFNVIFTYPELVSASTPGVLVRKAICGLGEHNAPSGFCERCVGYTYSLDAGKKQCDPAPQNTHGPGGAVFVPNAGFWHSAVSGFDGPPPPAVTAAGAPAFNSTALLAIRR